MAQATEVSVRAEVKINVAKDTAFTDKLFKAAITISQNTEEAVHNRYDISGAAVDSAVPFGNVTSPTLLLLSFVSKFNGGGSTTDDDPATVTVKIDGGTAFECKYLLLAVDIDKNTDKITNTITFTTLADSDTTVEVVVVGEKA